jgi:hypothetical protein
MLGARMRAVVSELFTMYGWSSHTHTHTHTHTHAHTYTHADVFHIGRVEGNTPAGHVTGSPWLWVRAAGGQPTSPTWSWGLWSAAAAAAVQVKNALFWRWRRVWCVSLPEAPRARRLRMLGGISRSMAPVMWSQPWLSTSTRGWSGSRRVGSFFFSFPLACRQCALGTRHPRRPTHTRGKSAKMHSLHIGKQHHRQASKNS